MNKKDKLIRDFSDAVLTKTFKYIDKNPSENILKILSIAEKLLAGQFPQKNLDAIKDTIKSQKGVYYDFAMSILNGTDRDVLKKLLLSFGLGAGINGTKLVRKNREIYHCNIPFLVLLDPTSACNCHCEGCWSAEYRDHKSLTFGQMKSIITQCYDLGTRVFFYTGGEPLLRKKDLIRLCEEFPDCVFLAFTNGTLVDDDFCWELKRVGNLILAVSIEGDECSNDARRGNGMYQKAINALSLLKEYKLFYGISVCYTSKNCEMVTSDEFLDKMISLGAKFSLYFNYMPVGREAPVSLIPTVAQREHMYSFLKQIRNKDTGKPIFVMDFQDDGEYVGGCIAGGRNYFHINPAGDMEPCVFIHYSDSNINSKSILEGLRSPLFMAYYHNQPFNDNHLRPCPMLENPDCLRKIVFESGAHPTNLVSPESADELCSKCDKFAREWAPKADELWKNNKHPNPKTQYYRDSVNKSNEN